MIIGRRRFVGSTLATVASLPVGLVWADTASVGAIPASLAAITGAGRPTTLTAAEVKELRASLRGQLLLAKDEGYDSARRLNNPMFDKHPALIARCAGPEDVVQAVNFARAHALLTAVRGGGHSLSGQSSCDGGLMIDLAPMKRIRIDAQRQVGQAQGGVLLGELDRKMQAVGLATTMGTATDTGIAGLTLGGGMGRLMRCHGLACDNLLSVEIVTADGTLRHASATENPDLFWGIRGGGGNFGVVTDFEYQLHPLTGKVLDGGRLYPISQARSVITAMAELGEHSSDELLLGAVLLASPPGGTHPAGRFIQLEGTYIGDLKEGERQLAPFKKLGTPLADDLTAKSYLAAQGAVSTAPVAAPNATSTYTKTGFLRGAQAQFIDELVRRFEAAPPFLSAEVVVAQMGGAVARVAQTATAFWNRPSTHDVLISGEVDGPIAGCRADCGDPRGLGRRGTLHAGLLCQHRAGCERAARARHLRRQLRPPAATEKQIRPDQPVPHEREHQADRLERNIVVEVVLGAGGGCIAEFPAAGSRRRGLLGT
ncbi:MAG: FAD-dependent oxidoreductase [Steroidobacteraceae bacterium]